FQFGTYVNGFGGRLEPTMTVVFAIYPNRFKLICQYLDLTFEILRCETPLPQRTGQCICGSSQLHSCIRELSHQTGHQNGVARVIQLTLVDAHQRVSLADLDRCRRAESTYEMGML